MEGHVAGVFAGEKSPSHMIHQNFESRVIRCRVVWYVHVKKAADHSDISEIVVHLGLDHSMKPYSYGDEQHYCHTGPKNAKTVTLKGNNQWEVGPNCCCCTLRGQAGDALDEGEQGACCAMD